MEGNAASNDTFLIGCPPSSPPPSPPPDFGSWSAQVPAWFWFMFVVTMLLAVAGTLSITYTLRMLYTTRRELRALGHGRGRTRDGTADALTRLESHVSHMCSGI